MQLLVGRKSRAEKMVKREKPDLRNEDEYGQRPFFCYLFNNTTRHHIFVLNKIDCAKMYFVTNFTFFDCYLFIPNAMR